MLYVYGTKNSKFSFWGAKIAVEKETDVPASRARKDCLEGGWSCDGKHTQKQRGHLALKWHKHHKSWKKPSLRQRMAALTVDTDREQIKQPTRKNKTGGKFPGQKCTLYFEVSSAKPIPSSLSFLTPQAVHWTYRWRCRWSDWLMMSLLCYKWFLPEYSKHSTCTQKKIQWDLSKIELNDHHRAQSSQNSWHRAAEILLLK